MQWAKMEVVVIIDRYMKDNVDKIDKLDKEHARYIKVAFHL